MRDTPRAMSPVLPELPPGVDLRIHPGNNGAKAIESALAAVREGKTALLECDLPETPDDPHGEYDKLLDTVRKRARDEGLVVDVLPRSEAPSGLLVAPAAT